MNAQKVIAELDEDIVKLETDIAELRSARATIVKLYGGDLPEEPAVKKTRKARTPRAVHVPTTPAASAGEPAPAEEPRKRGGQMSAQTIALIAVVRKMPEPITTENLAVAGGVDKKVAANFIFVRCIAEGWLAKVGRGQYQRTKDFPPAI